MYTKQKWETSWQGLMHMTKDTYHATISLNIKMIQVHYFTIIYWKVTEPSKFLDFAHDLGFGTTAACSTLLY